MARLSDAALLALLVLTTGTVTVLGSRFGLGQRVWDRWASHHDRLMRPEGLANSTTFFFNGAILDHFRASVSAPSKQWSQRYYVDQSVWCGAGCPVFLYIGGEGPQGPVSDHLFMYTLAKKHGALVVALEHRFYGESQPVADMSSANLQFLTSEQALADLAHFRTYLASVVPGADSSSTPALHLKASASESKFVAFGGSYPGNLAAWVKIKYGSLFVGTVASSAPLYAEYNYEQYAQVVGFALGHPVIGGSSKCVDILTSAASALRSLVKSTTPMGTSKDIPKALQPCSPMTLLEDLVAYEADVFGNFQGVVQYNLESPGVHVSDVCKTVEAAASPLDALAAATALFVNQKLPFQKRCLQSSYEKDVVAPLKNVTFDGESSMRQWIWQSCNEFGYFQTTTGAHHPFSSFTEAGIELLGSRMCAEAYGITNYMGPNTLWANTNYGNRFIGEENITFPNGNTDPWHALGVVNASDPFYQSCTDGPCTSQHLQATDRLVFMDGTAHCRDMYAPGLLEKYNISDTVDVKLAHATIADRVATYLM